MISGESVMTRSSSLCVVASPGRVVLSSSVGALLMMRCSASWRQRGYPPNVLGGRMLKSDLVRRILAQNPHLYLQAVEKIVDALFDEIITSMARGKRVELRGFGAFTVKVHEARTGRNPRTGAQVPVPKRAHPHFKPGKGMKERLNRQTD